MRIIVNADDFGLNRRCTDAICAAFDKGLVSETSLIANGSAFEYAIKTAQKKMISEHIGIHFNLTEGLPLTERIKEMATFTQDGIFHGKINRLKPLTHEEKQAVYEELTAQVTRCEKSRIEFSHADSHHHIHTGVFIAPIVFNVCKEHGIDKIRIHRNIGRISKVKRLEKYLYNKWLKMRSFKTTTWFGSMKDVEISGLRDNLEIMVHPDFDPDNMLIDRIDESEAGAIGDLLSLPADGLILSTYGDL